MAPTIATMGFGLKELVVSCEKISDTRIRFKEAGKQEINPNVRDQSEENLRNDLESKSATDSDFSANDTDADVEYAPTSADTEEESDSLKPCNKASEKTPKKKGPYKCDICNSSFSRPWRLSYHMNTHEGKRTFKCSHEGCDKTYSYPQHLKRHVEAAHCKKTEQPIVLCSFPGCGALLTSRALRKHTKMKHDESNFAYTCKQCDKKFQKKNLLNRHLEEHKGVTYKCDHCEISFKSRSCLSKHVNKHRKYFCKEPGCDKAFVKMSLLSKHKTEHKDSFKDLVCLECDKKFKNSGLLHRHIKTHNPDITEFKCPFEECSKTYFHNRNLTAHIRTRHNRLGFKCTWEDCEKTFAHKKSVDAHVKRDHESPAKPRKSPKTDRKRRNDAGIPKKAMACVLSNFAIPYSVQKRMLKDRQIVKEDSVASETCSSFESTSEICLPANRSFSDVLQEAKSNVSPTETFQENMTQAKDSLVNENEDCITSNETQKEFEIIAPLQIDGIHVTDVTDLPRREERTEEDIPRTKGAGDENAIPLVVSPKSTDEIPPDSFSFAVNDKELMELIDMTSNEKNDSTSECLIASKVSDTINSELNWGTENCYATSEEESEKEQMHLLDTNKLNEWWHKGLVKFFDIINARRAGSFCIVGKDFNENTKPCGICINCQNAKSDELMCLNGVAVGASFQVYNAAVESSEHENMLSDGSGGNEDLSNDDYSENDNGIEGDESCSSSGSADNNDDDGNDDENNDIYEEGGEIDVEDIDDEDEDDSKSGETQNLNQNSDVEKSVNCEAVKNIEQLHLDSEDEDIDVGSEKLDPVLQQQGKMVDEMAKKESPLNAKNDQRKSTPDKKLKPKKRKQPEPSNVSKQKQPRRSKQNRPTISSPNSTGSPETNTKKDESSILKNGEPRKKTACSQMGKEQWLRIMNEAYHQHLKHRNKEDSE